MLNKSKQSQGKQKSSQALDHLLSSLSDEQQEELKGGGPPITWWPPTWPPGINNCGKDS